MMSKTFKPIFILALTLPVAIVHAQEKPPNKKNTWSGVFFDEKGAFLQTSNRAIQISRDLVPTDPVKASDEFWRLAEDRVRFFQYQFDEPVNLRYSDLVPLSWGYAPDFFTAYCYFMAGQLSADPKRKREAYDKVRAVLPFPESLLTEAEKKERRDHPSRNYLYSTPVVKMMALIASVTDECDKIKTAENRTNSRAEPDYSRLARLLEEAISTYETTKNLKPSELFDAFSGKLVVDGKSRILDNMGRKQLQVSLVKGFLDLFRIEATGSAIKINALDAENKVVQGKAKFFLLPLQVVTDKRQILGRVTGEDFTLSLAGIMERNVRFGLAVPEALKPAYDKLMKLEGFGETKQVLEALSEPKELQVRPEVPAARLVAKGDLRTELDKNGVPHFYLKAGAFVATNLQPGDRIEINDKVEATIAAGTSGYQSNEIELTPNKTVTFKASVKRGESVSASAELPLTPESTPRLRYLVLNDRGVRRVLIELVDFAELKGLKVDGTDVTELLPFAELTHPSGANRYLLLLPVFDTKTAPAISASVSTNKTAEGIKDDRLALPAQTLSALEGRLPESLQQMIRFATRTDAQEVRDSLKAAREQVSALNVQERLKTYYLEGMKGLVAPDKVTTKVAALRLSGGLRGATVVTIQPGEETISGITVDEIPFEGQGKNAVECTLVMPEASTSVNVSYVEAGKTVTRNIALETSDRTPSLTAKADLDLIRNARQGTGVNLPERIRLSALRSLNNDAATVFDGLRLITSETIEKAALALKDDGHLDLDDLSKKIEFLKGVRELANLKAQLSEFKKRLNERVVMQAATLDEKPEPLKLVSGLSEKFVSATVTVGGMAVQNPKVQYANDELRLPLTEAMLKEKNLHIELMVSALGVSTDLVSADFKPFVPKPVSEVVLNWQNVTGAKVEGIAGKPGTSIPVNLKLSGNTPIAQVGWQWIKDGKEVGPIIWQKAQAPDEELITINLPLLNKPGTYQLKLYGHKTEEKEPAHPDIVQNSPILLPVTINKPETKYLALLIGITCYEPDKPSNEGRNLRGAAKDIQNLKKMLTETFGYTENSILNVQGDMDGVKINRDFDDDLRNYKFGKTLTRKNIENIIGIFEKRVKEENVGHVFIYYSGHGSNDSIKNGTDDGSHVDNMNIPGDDFENDKIPLTGVFDDLVKDKPERVVIGFMDACRESKNTIVGASAFGKRGRLLHSCVGGQVSNDTENGGLYSLALIDAMKEMKQKYEDPSFWTLDNLQDQLTIKMDKLKTREAEKMHLLKTQSVPPLDDDHNYHLPFVYQATVSLSTK